PGLSLGADELASTGRSVEIETERRNRRKFSLVFGSFRLLRLFRAFFRSRFLTRGAGRTLTNGASANRQRRGVRYGRSAGGRDRAVVSARVVRREIKQRNYVPDCAGNVHAVLAPLEAQPPTGGGHEEGFLAADAGNPADRLGGDRDRGGDRQRRSIRRNCS